jgi:hypothetical protein
MTLQFGHAYTAPRTLPTLRRPSLGARDDPSRPCNIETEQQIAEFKFSSWKGSDAMRKRQLF